MNPLKHGFIARNTAVGGVPSYRGYDLKERFPTRAPTSIDDYELIFNTFSCEKLTKLDSKKVLENLNRTYLKCNTADQKIRDSIDQLDKEFTKDNDTKVIPVNGQVIKEIIQNGKEQKAVLRSNDLEVANETLQKMYQGLVDVREEAMFLKDKLTEEMRIGLLDVEVQGVEEMLVIHTSTNRDTKPCDATVEATRVKQTIYLMCSMHRSDTSFRNKVNCEVKHQGYTFTVSKDKLSISKEEGNFDELELAIAKDLLKMF